LRQIALLLLLSSLLFGAFSGKIVDLKSGKAIKNAIVSDDKKNVKTDNNGRFHIETFNSHLRVKAYGYRPLTIPAYQQLNKSTYKATPFKMHAFYVNFYAASSKSKSFQKILKKIKQTKMNAVIIDIKDVKGQISYRTKVKEANKIGASKIRTIKDLPAFLRELKKMHIYTIARIAVFKDTLQAKKFPSRAVKKNGKIWIDKHNTAWIDPNSYKGQNYTLKIAVDAAKNGFDEINFDYIRFPAKKGLQFAKANNQTNRVAAIEQFLERAKERLRPYGVFISVDIFGYVAWNKTDTYIGQTVTSLAKHTDYIYPMLYPSGFYRGTLGLKDPTAYPYEIVKASIKKMHKDIEPIRVRAWLQSFRDYAFKHVNYKEYEIAQQIKASNDAGTSGWLLWNPSSRYPYVNKKLFYKVKHDRIKKIKKHKKKK